MRRPESSPAAERLPERCELFCSSPAGRLGLRVLLRVPFSPSPLAADLVPCPRPPPERLRRRGRESSPEDFSPVGLDLLRELPSLAGFDLLRELPSLAGFDLL
ncbi:MAG: hypothetical protein VX254_08895, partial [Planctomycetota bacterium]|nr:hypothetical protein [Planctomycetota bacterium]